MSFSKSQIWQEEYIRGYFINEEDKIYIVLIFLSGINNFLWFCFMVSSIAKYISVQLLFKQNTDPKRNHKGQTTDVKNSKVWEHLIERKVTAKRGRFFNYKKRYIVVKYYSQIDSSFSLQFKHISWLNKCQLMFCNSANFVYHIPQFNTKECKCVLYFK